MFPTCLSYVLATTTDKTIPTSVIQAACLTPSHFDVVRKVIQQKQMQPPAPRYHNDIYKWCLKLPETTDEDKEQNDFIIHWLNTTNNGGG
jgi:hypothetical protein